MAEPGIRSVEAFVAAVEQLPVAAHPEHFADDIAALRAAFPDDEGFTAALQATLAELRAIVRSPEAWGVAMTGHYSGWRRSAYPSRPLRGRRADLRTVFRALPDGRVELRAFGHRWLPAALYRRARGRPES